MGNWLLLIGMLYGAEALRAPKRVAMHSVQLPAVVNHERGKSMQAKRSAEHEQTAINDLLTDGYQLPKLELGLDLEHLDAGRVDSPLGLQQATRLAMDLILDDQTAVEAPLNLAALALAMETKSAQPSKAELKAYLLRHLAEDKSSLYLYQGFTKKPFSLPPERGEDPESNWIFVLRVPTLSDHITWVVIEKTGQKPPYLYGFN